MGQSFPVSIAHVEIVRVRSYGEGFFFETEIFSVLRGRERLSGEWLYSRLCKRQGFFLLANVVQVKALHQLLRGFAFLQHAHVRVNRGRGDVGVAQELLYGFKVHVLGSQVGPEGMPKRMTGDVFCNTGKVGEAIQPLLNPIGLHAMTPEHVTLISVLDLLQPREKKRGQRKDPVSASFAFDPQGMARLVDVPPLKIPDFGAPQSAEISAPEICSIERVGRLQDGTHLLRREHRGNGRMVRKPLYSDPWHVPALFSEPGTEAGKPGQLLVDAAVAHFSLPGVLVERDKAIVEGFYGNRAQDLYQVSSGDGHIVGGLRPAVQPDIDFVVRPEFGNG